jgi:hypothetical protein
MTRREQLLAILEDARNRILQEDIDAVAVILTANDGKTYHVSADGLPAPLYYGAAILQQDMLGRPDREPINVTRTLQ